MEYGIFLEFLFSILENLQESTKKIIFSGIFLAFKSKLQVIHVTTYFALFLPDTSYLLSIIFQDLSLFCFYFSLFSYIAHCETHPIIYNV